MSLGKSMLPEFEMEMASTRKVLERVPDDKFDWKIHEKSNTIGWVANHLADIPSWVEGTLAHDSFDVEPVPGKPHGVPQETSTAAILTLFDKHVAQAKEILPTATDQSMHESWSLTKQGEILMTMPRIAVLRNWVLNHTIHHRAHLCVYLRVNDVAVPGLYGPSGDDAPM